MRFEPVSPVSTKWSEKEFPPDLFPPFLERASNFYLGPLISCVVVFLFILDGVGVPLTIGGSFPIVSTFIVPGMGFAAVLAVLALAYILLGPTGEIARSTQTSYPVPDRARDIVWGRIKNDQLSSNIDGLDGQSYCTRCFVWRPKGSHHCRICQRCVTGFDHHCSFFGRCITSHNMLCFQLILGLLFLAFAAQAVTFMIAYSTPATPAQAAPYQGPYQPGYSQRPTYVQPGNYNGNYYPPHYNYTDSRSFLHLLCSRSKVESKMARAWA